MNPTFRGAGRTLLPIALTLAAATAHPQSAPQTQPDTTKKDSTTKQAPQPGKRGFFARAAGAATQAAAVVQQKTGVDPKTALTGAALMAAKANPGVAMFQAMQAAQQVQATQSAGAGIAGRLSGAAGMGMGAAQMQALQRMMMGPAMPAASASSSELSALQLQITQIATRAAQGDRGAMDQLMRFQREMAGASMRMTSLAPAQQQSALPIAMRAAIACVMTNQQCMAPVR